MNNLRMKEKLDNGEAIDLSDYPKKDGCIIIDHSLIDRHEAAGGLDFCDAKEERWIWSIGKNLITNEILASYDARFYQKEGWECLWLR